MFFHAEVMDTRLLAVCLCALTVVSAFKVHYNGNLGKNIDGRDPTAGLRDYDFTYYLTLDQMNAYLDEMDALCGARCSLVTIGSSWEGRDLRVFKVSTGGTGKRSIWLHSGVIPKVRISVATGLYLIDRLVKDFDTDPDIQNILNSYDVYIQPNVNPDGYEFTWTTDFTWQKTRSIRPESECQGVDYGNNFGYHWGEGGPTNPCAIGYIGPSGFSEPETSAVADFILDPERLGSWDLFISFEWNGNTWISPYYYTETLPVDNNELLRVAEAGASALSAAYGTWYYVASASTLSRDDGTSIDWAHDVAGIPYAYIIDPRDPTTFVLPEDEIIPNGYEIWMGFKGTVAAILNP